MKCLYLILISLFCVPIYGKIDHFAVNFLDYQNEKIRTGILKTDKSVLKGTVLYMQGFGDSMMNHMPLFQTLAGEGYNIVAFDYRGQGGSSGSMNLTTIQNITKLADEVWKYYITDSKQKKIILGWSTGGLAAYYYAFNFPEKVESIILLSPGIVMRENVGDVMFVTREILTRNKFIGKVDPHIDEIYPASALFSAPLFAANMYEMSVRSRSWKIAREVKGLVLLASKDDAFVINDVVLSVVKKNASHFRKHMYKGTGALHELDNEVESISIDVGERVIAFLKEYRGEQL